MMETVKTMAAFAVFAAVFVPAMTVYVAGGYRKAMAELFGDSSADTFVGKYGEAVD